MTDNIESPLIFESCFLFSLGTLEYFRVVETLSETTLVFHQVYKRVWPSSQRDMVFVSNIRDIPPSRDIQRLDNVIGPAWLVSNYSVDHPEAPVSVKWLEHVCALWNSCVNYLSLAIASERKWTTELTPVTRQTKNMTLVQDTGKNKWLSALS